MNIKCRQQKGFSIVELMVGTFVGLILSYAVLQIYLAQTQTYKTSNSQALIQSTENAIVSIVTPIIRSTGFSGCGTLISAVSNLNAGGPNPIGMINTTPTLIMGYNGGSTSIILQSNAANDTNTNDWSPALDGSLAGSVEKGSDALIVLGAAPNSNPITITSINNGASILTLQGTNGTSINQGQLAAVSDCAKTIVFNVSGINGTSISHTAGLGALNNANSNFSINFQAGSQFIPLQQTAFFVAQGPGGQSALMRATLNGTSWNIQPIVPGVEIMKVQYGIGSGGTVNQYVTADAVTNWSQVYAVRLGFLIAGQIGSGNVVSTPFSILGTSVKAPADSRIRHVLEITINLRNALT
ncbi:MAG: PilW family protein [Legionella sp.]|jgi:type IV pilus assembly protein PilW